MVSEAELRRVIDGYTESVRSGELLSCRFVRLAVERWYADLERDDLFFDIGPLMLFSAFTEQLKHFKGDLSGMAITLEPWQIFIVANVLGLKYKATGKRRYKYADVLVPRKNGKTTFAAIFALYMLFLDGESGSEVYTAAVDKAQAKICFDAAKVLAQNSIFASRMTFHRGDVRYDKSNSVLSPLSKDTKNKDGLNPHGAICDERHAWSTNEIYDVIKTGMGARSQPLMLSISTAGTDRSLPYYEDIQTYKDVMMGLKEMDNHFIMLYMPDEGDKWDDPATWKKVNPNLGVSLLESYMEQEAAEAKVKGGSTLVSFMVKNLNMWVDAPEVWIPDDTVSENNADFDEAQLQGQECYVGIDLASKGDITATSLYFPKFNVVKLLCVVPESKVEEQKDRVDYRRWQDEGWLTVTPGKVLDEEWFVSWLLMILSRYKVKCIAYDPWGMWDIVQKLSRYERELMEYPQNIRYMSVPTKWFESAVLRGELNFLYNPVMRWMMSNVTIYTDPNANIKLDKAKSRNKIDGVVATVDAIGGWLTKTAEQKKIYTGHNLRTVKL